MKTRILLSITAALLAYTGCTAPTELFPEPLPLIQTNLADPVGLRMAYELALERMDIDAYVALLEQPGPATDGFRYYVANVDAELLPWMESPVFFPYDVEVAVIADLMDPEPLDRQPVSAIQTDFEVLDQREVNGEIEMLLAAEIRVEAGQAQSWIADTKLDLSLAPDASGFLRIHSIREHGPVGPSWHRVMGLPGHSRR